METALWLAVLVLVLLVAGTAAWAGLRAAPYVPTLGRDVDRLLDIAQVRPGETVIDLGGGDGRIVAAAAARGANAIGYEISLLPYLVGWIRCRFSPNRARISWQARDFFQTDVSAADVVTVFLTPMAMKKLEPKLSRELRPGTRVVSYAFQVPGWVPVRKDKPDPRRFAIWVYQRA